MRIAKSIQLTTNPMENLLRRGEALDFRLDEKTWQDLHPGDHIEFWEDFTGWQTAPTDSSRKVIVKIDKIFRAATFPELIHAIELELEELGGRDELLRELRSWWDGDKEIRTGVLAFYVILAGTAP